MRKGYLRSDNGVVKHTISAVVVVALILGRPVYGLECVDFPVQNLMNTAEIVLLGRIDAVRFNMVDANAATHSIYTVSVKELWKGTTPRVIELHQRFIGGGIDFWGEIGKDYVLFVRTITPEQPLSVSNGPNVTSGFVAAECWSRPPHGSI